MKQKKLSSIFAITLSLEMMLSPLYPAYAQGTPPTAAPPSSSLSSVATNAEGINTVIQGLGNIWSAAVVRGNLNQMNPQMAGDMAELQSQQTVQPDKYFNPQKLMQIPGLGNYLALNNINPQMLDCRTLPTTMFEANPEVCRIGITNDKGIAPQAQMQQMFTYHNQYFQIKKMYSNFLADSNSDGQGFGVGCMYNAMNILNGFFKYRIDELDKLTTNLEAMQNQFREASRSDLDAIEEAVAVLDGDSEMADKVKSKRPDLFDYNKRFNNPACNSMFAGEAMNEKGRAGGLNQINQDLKRVLTEKKGKFSGDSYSKAHSTVIQDINSLADKASKQLELNFGTLSKDANSYSKFLADLPDLISSPNGTNRAITADIFSDVQTKFNENFLRLSEQKGTVLNELRSAGVSGDVAANLFGNTTSSNFDAEVATIENRLKNRCFQSTLASINKDTLLDRIYDPSASRHANKFASNFLKDKLNLILNDQDSSLEKKLADLRSLEGQTGSRYYMRMENSYEVQDVNANGEVISSVVGASTQRTPSVFFSDMIRNCNAQFKSNKLDNKMSGAGAIQSLRQLNNQYKDLARNQALDMKRELRKRLIECDSPEVANNTVPGSCTPERFNPSAPGFCANAAFSCSKNMQACSQQAEQFTKQIKEQKTARVTNYKALMLKNKQDIVKIFDSALARYMKDGEAMRGIFGAGFASPKGIQREVPESQRYLSDFQEATSRSIDGKLLLEDPEAYTKMIANNIEALKKSVKDQQNQILGGEQVGKSGGLLADHINKTKKNYQDAMTAASSISDRCLAAHDGAIKGNEEARRKQEEDYRKQMSELGEKRNKFCSAYMLAKDNPKAGCGGNLQEIISGAMQAASSIQGQVNDADLRRLNQYCAERVSTNEDNASVEENPAVICDTVPATDTSSLGVNCANYRRLAASCGNERKNDNNNNNAVSTCVPSDLRKDIADLYRAKKQNSGTKPRIELEDEPAYCTAGADGNRDVTKGGIQGVVEAFARGVTAQ